MIVRERPLPGWRTPPAIAIILAASILAGAAGRAGAQGLPPLPSTTPGGPPASTPATPTPAPSPPQLPEPTTVEDRLNRLEEQNRLLLEQNRRLSDQLERLTGQYQELRDRPAANVTDLGGAGARDNPAGAERFGGGSDAAALPNDTADIAGAGARDNVSDDDERRLPSGSRKAPLLGTFGSGFELATKDEEFQVQFHNETQVEYRSFDHTGQGSLHDGFFLPRQIWWFTGRITKPIEYYTSFQKGLGSVNVRDAFLNFHYDDRIMFKAGRFKSPFTYEFYAISNQDLMQPERSLFAINYGDNRQLGAMGWGQLFDDRLDYAVGTFNGPRNSFENTNNSLNVVSYLHARPFAKSQDLEFLQNLGVGGSVDFGNEDNPLLPNALRTAVNAGLSSGNSTASPAFLVFNPNVREYGERALWNLHATYFYRGLSLLAEWDSGFAGYGPIGRPEHVQVPVNGYYVSASYFLTGETVPRRTRVDIRRPFNLKPGEFGLGAFEVQARYSALSVGREVFTYGLSDPNLWSNSASTVDAGLNWYLNRYVKVYFDWQHAMFGSPVVFQPGVYHQTSNLFWLRLQIYF